MTVTFDLMTIIMFCIILFVIALIIGLIIFVIKSNKAERLRRDSLKSDSIERNKVFWSELYNSNEGYEEKAELNHKKYVVPLAKTKRNIISIDFGQSEYRCWVSMADIGAAKSDDIHLETYNQEDKLVEFVKVQDGDDTYIVDEKVYDYDETTHEIERFVRTKIYTNMQAINGTAENKAASDDGERTKRHFEYHYQLICVANNEITPLWFDTKEDAMGYIKKTIDVLISHNKDDVHSMKITDNKAVLRKGNDKYNWLIVDLY